MHVQPIEFRYSRAMQSQQCQSVKLLKYLLGVRPDGGPPHGQWRHWGADRPGYIMQGG